MSEKAKKRCFFGASIVSPWQPLPTSGREIKEEMRHITLAFLGNVEELPDCRECPLPTFHLGPIGKALRPLFLPHDHPRVAAYEVAFMTNDLLLYQEKLTKWLNLLLERAFLPHITLMRAPLGPFKVWNDWFRPIPLFLSGIHLYESVGDLSYIPRWSHTLLPPFEAISHTADLAFLVRGETLDQIYLHAVWALAFLFPPVERFREECSWESLEEIISALNRIIANVDIEMGCPIKAVSFHGQLVRNEERRVLEWEMILDV